MRNSYGPFEQYISDLASYPRMSASQQNELGYEMKRLRHDIKEKLFRCDVAASSVVALIKETLRSPLKQHMTMLDTSGTETHHPWNAKVASSLIGEVERLLSENKKLYMVAFSKSELSSNRQHAWDQLGRNKSRMGSLLCQVPLRPEVIDRLSDQFVTWGTETKTLLSRVPRDDRGFMLPSKERTEIIKRLCDASETKRSLTRRVDQVGGWLDRVRECRNALAESCLRLVVREASRLVASKKGDPSLLMDMIQAGNTGLLRAAASFDPARGVLSTIATTWIRKEIREALQHIGQIYVPPTMRDPQRQQQAVDAPLRGGNLSRTAKKERTCLIAAMATTGVVSIHQPSPDKSKNSLLDEIASHEDPQSVVMWKEIETIFGDAVKKLSKDRQDLFELHRDGASIAEVAEMFGVGEPAIRERYRSLRKQLVKVITDEDLRRKVESPRKTRKNK